MPESRQSTATPAPTLAPADEAAARAAVPSCALDEEGLRLQRERQALLAPSVGSVSRNGLMISIAFEPGFDRGTLEEMIAVERRCCPFFELNFDEAKRRLDVGVRDPQHAPMLEALAWSLGAAYSA
jgi:hypothetical protein